MRRHLKVAGWVVGLLAVLAATAGAAAGEPVSPEVWGLIKGLTWPSATVWALFSPPSRAVAAWIQARAAPATIPQSGSARSQELTDMTAALREVVTHVKRGNEVQTRTVEALTQVERGLAVLLDRYPRAGGQAG